MVAGSALFFYAKTVSTAAENMNLGFVTGGF